MDGGEGVDEAALGRVELGGGGGAESSLLVVRLGCTRSSCGDGGTV